MDEWMNLRKDADKGREPRLISSLFGSRWISMAALVEQIASAFTDEYGEDSPEVREAATPAQRLRLLLGTAEYIIATESAHLSNDQKAEVINRAYSELFGYGPLDALFLDERVTTIALEGADRASVRLGQDELQLLEPIFQNDHHFRRVVKRLLLDAGAELRDDQPYIEVGMMAGERPIAINLVAPPAAFQLTLDIRLHPATLPTWDNLVQTQFLTNEAASLLQAISRSAHGIMVIGEPASGKTTLLNLITQSIPTPESVIAVERAGEMRLPAAIRRYAPQWPVAERRGISFGEQIQHALAEKPGCLILDEVRADEPLTIAPLLQMDNSPRQIWSFRSAIFIKRLQSALGMLARRADTASGDEMVRALYERLPFVVAVNRVNHQLKLWSVGEWQFKHSPDYPTYVPLLQVESGELKPTGESPYRTLS